jgi:hypothetical protein
MKVLIFILRDGLVIGSRPTVVVASDAAGLPSADGCFPVSDAEVLAAQLSPQLSEDSWITRSRRFQ